MSDEAPQRRHFADVLAIHRITMEVVQLTNETHEDYGPGSTHWRCTFKRAGHPGELVTPFHQGVGISYKGNVEPGLSWQEYMSKPWLIKERPWVRRRAKPIPPKPEDVMSALISDARADDQTFEEWSSDFGYDTDSRKAFELFHRCAEIGKKLRVFLGPAILEEFRNCEPR